MMEEEKNIKRNSRVSRKRESPQNGKTVNKIKMFLLLLVFIPMLLYSGIYIIRWYLDTKKSEKNIQEISKDIEKNVVKTKNGKNKVDLKSFKEINPDTKGVLEIKALDIKNVIVQTNNNNYYSTHDFNKNKSLAGWIYVDYRNKFNAFDKNIVIYGQNMRDGKTMFTPLTKMLDVNFLKDLKEDEKEIKILTDIKEDTYKIFSVYSKNEKDLDIKDLLTESRIKLNEMIPNLKKQSILDFNVDTENAEQILTITTGGKTNSDRVIIHAVKVKKQNNNLNK